MRVLALAVLLSFGSAVAQTSSFGNGCDLRSGLAPGLFVSPRPAPWIDVSARGFAVAPSVPAVLLLGFSRDFAGGTPLPFELSPLGMPGCRLYVSPDFALPFGADGAVSLPTSRLPAGGELFLQALCVDASGAPSAMSFGLALAVPDPLAPFAFAMLPDTQFYSEDPALYRHFLAQVDWVAQHAQDVLFCSQVGDIVQNGARYPAEWIRASQAMARLDGVVPYAVALGNHDFDVVNDKRNATAFLAAFSPARWSGRSGFLGGSPDGRNTAQLFDARGWPMLLITLEWHPSDAAIAWAQEILARHPQVPAILTTHEHLGTGLPAPFRTPGATPDASGDNAALDVHRKLIEPFPQLFLVLCGHVHGAGRRSDVTPLGMTVHAILADYQSDVQGGNGWFRLLEFAPRSATLRVRPESASFAPGSGTDWRGNAQHDFTLAVDLAAHRARLATTTIRRFRDGSDFGAGSYAGTQDTRLGDGSAGGTLPGLPRGNDALTFCDGDGDHDQSLLRFDGLVGTGAGAIPPGTRIQRALLTLTTEGDSSQSADGGRLHRMLVPWNEQSTWHLLGGGVQLGSEALLAHDADARGLVTSKGTTSFDVTASVQSWIDGAPNHGWVFVANGSDGWGFRTAEHDGIAERPMLCVLW